MALELQQLRQVVALAEHGSFVRAAAALHISQPALSRSIQGLERRFGSSLFLRSAGGVVPTDLGRLYIERARDLLRMADELEGEAIGHAAMRTGRVDVGGGPYPTDSFLGPAVARFVEQFPQVGVQLHSSDWDDLVHQLRSRTLDFFVAETSLLAREPDLDVVPMPVRHPAYFFARANHPLTTSSATIRAAEVMAWPFATPSRIPPRVLDPMLAAHREGSLRRPFALPFPAVACNGLAPVKRIVAASDVVVLIGIKDAQPLGLNCGACGVDICELLPINTVEGEFRGPQCAYRLLDMGIALGSAVKTASMLNVDNRIMYRIGTVARAMKMVAWDFVMGIPLSATGKNIFFDR